MTRAARAGRCESAIRAYFGGVLDGSITACRKIKQVAEKILRDMDNKDPLYPYHYREEYAQKHVNFIERFCRLPSGKLGHAFKLELFQLAILSVIFGFVDAEGMRQYREVLWVMGRKNGKGYFFIIKVIIKFKFQSSNFKVNKQCQIKSMVILMTPIANT